MNSNFLLTPEEVKACQKLRAHFRSSRRILLAQLVEQLCIDSGADSVSLVITNGQVESVKLSKIYKSKPQPD